MSVFYMNRNVMEDTVTRHVVFSNGEYIFSLSTNTYTVSLISSAETTVNAYNSFFFKGLVSRHTKVLGRYVSSIRLLKDVGHISLVSCFFAVSKTSCKNTQDIKHKYSQAYKTRNSTRHAIFYSNATAVLVVCLTLCPYYVSVGINALLNAFNGQTLNGTPVFDYGRYLIGHIL